MMNFNQLRTFYYVAKYLSYKRASQKLFVTQPAVTVQVKALEEYFNLRLLQKKGRDLQLTKEGQTLYDYAEKIFNYETEIEKILDKFKKQKPINLHIGTTKAYATYFMPLFLAKFRDLHPNIIIYLNEGSSFEMIKSLYDFSNELVLVAKIDEQPEIFFQPICSEELVAIINPDHHLAWKKEVPFHQLAKEPIIMREKGSGTRKKVDELYRNQGLNPNLLMETNNAEFVKQNVQKGCGYSFLVRELVHHELKTEDLAEVGLQTPPEPMQIYIAYLKNHQLSLAAKNFLNAMKRLFTNDKRCISEISSKIISSL